MNGRQHHQTADEMLMRLDRLTDNGTKPMSAIDAQTILQCAQVHATLAQDELLREIGDQLDTLPRKRHEAPA